MATPGQGPDRPQEVSYTDTKVIGNGSFGVVYQAKLCDSGELVAIKKVLQDKRFKVRKHNALCIFIAVYFLKFLLLLTTEPYPFPFPFFPSSPLPLSCPPLLFSTPPFPPFLGY